MKKVVAFIPIKLNSERLPNKNILPIAGHPLCWHIANTILQIADISEVYVYCSDDRIMKYMPDKVKFLKRDNRLDGNLVKGEEIYKSFISQVDADIYILAHATSPFINKSSVQEALMAVKNGGYDSAFSAERIQTFAWYDGKTINYNLDDIPRTQDILPIWVETSAFYIFEKDIFVEHNRRIGFNPYIKEVSGLEAIDIDEKKDFDLAACLYKMTVEKLKNE